MVRRGSPIVGLRLSILRIPHQLFSLSFVLLLSATRQAPCTCAREMRLLGCVCRRLKWLWKRRRQQQQQQQRIDVLVDIDGTFVYSGEGPLQGPELLCSYRLAHGALEFLIALDRSPGVRISFYSCGAKVRNESLIKLVVAAVENRGLHIKQKMEVFSVAARMYGKKRLNGLRKGIDLSRTILVDDAGLNVEAGEEDNLLKVYVDKEFTGQLTYEQKVYKARVANNLIRALGMILKSINLSKLSGGAMTTVQALKSFQWDGDTYLHESSNAEEIYQVGMQAMQGVQPDFSFCLDTPSTYPWSSVQEDHNLFPRRRDLIIQEYVPL